MNKREDIGLVPMDEIIIWSFIPIGTVIFHAIFLGVTLDLPMPKHRQPWHSDHHGTNTKVFIAFTKLFYCSFFIWVIHEINIALENLRIVNQCVFNQLAVLIVFLIAQHVHKRTVIHAMHA